MTETRCVGDVMTPNPISIVDTASLAEAVAILDSRKVTGLPVVDAAGTLVGVLSQTDLVRAQADQQLVRNWPGLAVAEIMTKPALDHRRDREPRPGRPRDGGAPSPPSSRNRRSGQPDRHHLDQRPRSLVVEVARVMSEL